MESGEAESKVRETGWTGKGRRKKKAEGKGAHCTPFSVLFDSVGAMGVIGIRAYGANKLLSINPSLFQFYSYLFLVPPLLIILT